MADDPKKPYGDVEYADPGYQSDKKARYPLDSEDHIRAAWSYINQADNASAYSSEDLAKVKSKIKTAMKKIGAEVAGDSEGDAEDKSEPAEARDAIECRAAVTITQLNTNEILFLPAGLHSITPISGGIGKPIKVLVDSNAAAEVERQRSEITAKTGKKVYFDFNHEDGPASFWPNSFVWRPADGVVAKGEWTASGKRALEGKDFRAFSPVFFVNDKHADPARVVCRKEARPNMGGLVNDPAFSNLPLWAKNAGIEVGTSPESTAKNKKQGDTMTVEEIAALRAKNLELEQKIEALNAVVAKNADDETAKSQLEAANAEQRATYAEIQAAELKLKNEAMEATIRKRNKEDATALVKKVVKAGRIAAKNIVLQNQWIADATADPDRFMPLLVGMLGDGRAPWDQRIIVNPPNPISAGNGDGRIQILNDDPVSVYSKLALVLQNANRGGTHDIKAQCALEVAAIYAGAFADTEKNREQRTRLLNSRLDIVRDAIMAADVTDANLGTIAGTLVTQRTLELLKFVFPALPRFTTDFSDQPATYNQTIMTRIVTIPNVVTYSTASGWTDVTAATTDVPVVINNHKGIPITFNEQLLASTMRRLFNEFAEASAYALAKAMVDALYANLTDANFTNNSVVASASFVRNSVVDIGVALTQRGVPLGLGNRTMLLWPVAFGNLVKDSALVTFASYQQPRIVTEGTNTDASFVMPVDTFQVYTAPNMPSNNANLVGFAGSRSALCIATRVPNDYTSILPGASFGNVQIVSDPDLGISVMQVQYVNHVLGTATNRIALMWGTAPGQTAAGQLIKAAAGSGSSR